MTPFIPKAFSNNPTPSSSESLDLRHLIECTWNHSPVTYLRILIHVIPLLRPSEGLTVLCTVYDRYPAHFK